MLGEPEFKTLEQKLDHVVARIKEEGQTSLFETEEEKKRRLKALKRLKLKRNVILEIIEVEDEYGFAGY